jgi:hypothetical protein
MLVEQEPDTDIDPETLRYLAKVERDLYLALETRERIDRGLFFFSAQAGSLSLSYFLFNFQVTLSIIQLVCTITSLMPGLIAVSDGFSLSLSSTGWDLQLGSRPLVGIVQLGIGATVAWNGTAKVTQAVVETQKGITATYAAMAPDKSFFQAIDWVLLLGLLLAGLSAGFLVKGDRG